MFSESDVPAPGCLVLLLQMSASMKIDIPSHRGPFPKSHLVRLLADETVEDLVAGHREGVVPGNFEIAIVGYRNVNEGPAAISLLPDDKTHPHFLTVAQLAKFEVPRRKRGDQLPRWTGPCEEEGDSTPAAALATAHWIVQRWQADHPQALPPIIVHCCDATELSADYELIAQSLSVLQSSSKPPVLFHCVFSETFSGRMLPYQYCGGLRPALERLWNCSSALEPEQINCRGHAARGFAINDWPRSEIRQMWERYFAPPPIEPEAVEPLPQPDETPAVMSEPVVEEILELPGDAKATSDSLDEPEAQPISSQIEHEEESEVVESSLATPPPPAPLFSHRSFWLVKRGNDPNQWEDAYCIDPTTGAVAISDGAGAGIFCRQWAALLAERWVQDQPDLPDERAYRAWLDACRNAWMEAIGYKTIRIFQRMKVDDVGAAATLLGLRIDRVPHSGEYRWQAVAVGDSALFWVRDNHLLAAFPLTRGSQFDIAPLLLRSKRIASPTFARAGGICQSGDLFVLATDAVAHALFDEHDRGPVDWARFETLEQTAWEEEMERLRDENRMVNDDCTLVVLRVGEAPLPATSPQAEPGHSPEEPIAEIPNE